MKSLEEKVNEIIVEWCKWNTHEGDAKDFAFKFHKIFKKEITPIWKTYQAPK